MYKITVTDKASKKAHIELRTPNRKVLWDEAMKHREYSSLLIRGTRSESASVTCTLQHPRKCINLATTMPS